MSQGKLMIVLIIHFVILNVYSSFSQSTYTTGKAGPGDNLSNKEWAFMQQRWENFRPAAEIITYENDTVRGQLINTTSEGLIIYPGDEIPVNSYISRKTITVTLNQIKHISLKKGGQNNEGLIYGAIAGGGAGTFGGLLLAMGWSIVPPIVLGTAGAGGGALLGRKIERKIRLIDLYPLEGNLLPGEMQKLKKSSVYSSSCPQKSSLHDAINHSSLMKRSFMKKRFRISFSLSSGPNVVEDELRKMVSESNLHSLEQYRHGAFSAEFFDLAWRAGDRLFVGTHLFSNLDDYTYMSYSSFDWDLFYSYSIQSFGGKFYCEYVIKPGHRFLSSHTEILAGTGLVIHSPSIHFYYNDRYNPNPATFDGYFVKDEDFTQAGLLIKAAIHYYIGNTLSFSAGSEANIFPSLKPETFSISGSTGPLLEIQEYKLNFSSLRIKAGVSLYF